VFETVLVVDRSASAYRVVRTCQRLGARTAAVHGDDDRAAPGVRAADEAVPLGGRGWSESYGDVQKVLEAARRVGAQAVHPGGGWLAGDAALAQAVLDAGLVWLGPAPAHLDRSPAQVTELARSVGLVPAGSSGRRLVATTLDDGDRLRVLGVREQHRDAAGFPLLDVQPVGLPSDVLQQVEHAALVVSRAVGAGRLVAVGLTLDQAGEVGVEGLLPVLLPGSSATEGASGVDLVALQLRLAAGQPPDAAGPGGHALALHLRVADRFVGRLRRWTLPSSDDLDGVRSDAAFSRGDRVALSSEHTLAVLTVQGPDRATALSRARSAADAVVVEGLPTTLPTLRSLLAELADQPPAA
jgi:acetyl/propionyl-CoA carboxylase alpha subunit